tara:strand:+ start:12071 stop:12577 length:507 start_codon:yes stop_codon:yes gene_type:complete
MKHLFILILATISFGGFTQEKSDIENSETNFHHCYYPENSVTIGVGSTYSFKLNTVGVNTRVYYNVGEKWCFGPEFSYVEGSEETLYDMSFIGHYIIETPLVGIYPVVGGNYSIEKSEDNSISAFGIVFGGGVHRNFKNFTVFGEYTHIQSQLQDDFVSLGLMFTVDK